MRVGLGILIIIFLLYFSSCLNKQREEKYNVFHYNQPNKITSLDPAFAKSQNNIWACNHIYNGLVKLDDSLNIKPSIAKSWQIDESGLVYTFNLKSNVAFHESECIEDNRVVQASDFVYSLNRIISDDINSPGSWIFSEKVDSINPFLAIDDSTFQIKLREPFLPLMGILTMQYCSVIPEECVKSYGNKFRSNPVGTGPFKFKKWIEDQGLFLLTNHNYFEDVTHNLDGIRTSFIADEKIAFLELKKGNIDFISGIESSFINELLDSDGQLLNSLKGQFKMSKSPYLNMEYFGINMSNEGSPLRNKKFRQALNWAIDRDLMLQTLRNNIGKPANAGFIPRGLPSHNPKIVKGYIFDLIKAKNLLKESGYDVHSDQVITISTSQDYLDLTTFVARQWENIGIKVEIELMESALLREGMRNSDIPFFRASWIADYPEGENFMSMFYSKNPAPPNYTRFSNEEFDLLYEEALLIDEASERYPVYHEMEKILIDEAPVIFLFYDETALIYNHSLKGIRENGINLLNATSIEKDISN